MTQAFVLGAGLGTRLRPLTADLPKPLVPIFQKRLITFAFDHLIADAGVRALHLNTHHLPERFREVFPEDRYRDATLQFYHEPVLLETAGGIANVEVEADEPLLVYNADILSDLPLAPLLAAHARGGNLVTLALRSSGPARQIALKDDQVVDINNLLGNATGEGFLFTGIYIVSPEFRARLQRGVKRSVIPHFLEAIKGGERVGGVVIDEGNWWDVGTIAAYRELHRILPALSFPRYPTGEQDWSVHIHPSARIAEDAQVDDLSVIGENARVESGAKIFSSIIWPGAQIASLSELQNCIVRGRRHAARVQRDAII